jgi:hypothetical protein
MSGANEMSSISRSGIWNGLTSCQRNEECNILHRYRRKFMYTVDAQDLPPEDLKRIHERELQHHIISSKDSTTACMRVV